MKKIQLLALSLSAISLLSTASASEWLAEKNVTLGVTALESGFNFGEEFPSEFGKSKSFGFFALVDHTENFSTSYHYNHEKGDQYAGGGNVSYGSDYLSFGGRYGKAFGNENFSIKPFVSGGASFTGIQVTGRPEDVDQAHDLQQINYYHASVYAGIGAGVVIADKVHMDIEYRKETHDTTEQKVIVSIGYKF